MTFEQKGKLGASIISGTLAIVVGMAIGSMAATGIKALESPATGSNEMEGYYDPVNKVMCYWIKDSKATPACLYAEWPIEVEPTSGDEEYSKSKEATRNATYHY